MLPTIPVNIVIKPGDDNDVKLRGRGTVPVAILGSSTFDAASIDPASVTMAGAPVRRARRGEFVAALEDVNDDGLLDMVVHIEKQQLVLDSSSTTATLKGVTLESELFQGTDVVTVRP